jgi:hypothetical protein
MAEPLAQSRPLEVHQRKRPVVCMMCILRMTADFDCLPPTRQPGRLPHKSGQTRRVTFVGHASRVPGGWGECHERRRQHLVLHLCYTSPGGPHACKKPENQFGD